MSAPRSSRSSASSVGAVEPSSAPHAKRALHGRAGAAPPGATAEPRKGSSRAPQPQLQLNLAVVAGTVDDEVVVGARTDGSTYASFDLRVDRSVVPVLWHDPPASVAEVAAGEGVLVIGRVAKRFARGGGGATRARTSVIAEEVLVGRPQRRRLEAALNDAACRLRPAS